MLLQVSFCALLVTTVLSGSVATGDKARSGVFSSDNEYDFNWEIRKVALSEQLLLDVELINGTKRGDRVSVTSDDAMIPILLIHGMSESRLGWLDTVPHLLENGILPNNQLIILPSLRGHGNSNLYPYDDSTFTLAEHRSDITRLLSILGVEKAVWIGHSLAGWITMSNAVHNPQSMHSMVLIGSLPYLPTDLAAMFQYPKEIAYDMGAKYNILRQWENANLENGWLSAERAKLRITEMMKVSGKAMINGIADITCGNGDFRESARQEHVLNMRSMLLFGENDFCGADLQRQYASMIEANAVVEISDTGHDPHYTHPQQVANAFLQFIYATKVDKSEL